MKDGKHKDWKEEGVDGMKEEQGKEQRIEKVIEGWKERMNERRKKKNG